jgi:transcriptional regulator with XRE-family HTH domain
MNLDDYLTLKNLARPAFADLIGTTPQSLARYLDRSRIPKKETMVRIAEVTSGLVTANDFYGTEAAPTTEQATQ